MDMCDRADTSHLSVPRSVKVAVSIVSMASWIEAGRLSRSSFAGWHPDCDFGSVVRFFMREIAGTSWPASVGASSISSSGLREAADSGVDSGVDSGDTRRRFAGLSIARA